MSNDVFVIGVGLGPFATPSRSEPYTTIARVACRNALNDADINYDEVEQAYAGYVFGDSTCGQRVLYDVGMTGIPIINVNNNCATGSSALFLARQAIASGAADCVFAVGFEQMTPGAIGQVYTDRPFAMERFMDHITEWQGASDAPIAAQLFGGAGREHIEQYGTKPETFAKISVKARAHAAHNPLAVFRTPLTLEEVMDSPSVFDPLTRYQCCPPTCGAAAAVLCSEAFLKRHGKQRAVKLTAQAMTTDRQETFDDHSAMKLVGLGMTKRAADAAYEAAGIGPEDVDVIELHDCFTANELITYEGLGLTAPGTAERMIDDGDNTYGGRYVVNPSGGLLSKGHPLGATGLAQCAELVWQLRGEAGPRQVEGARIALQHNLGLGGACVVGIYEQAR